MAVITAAWQMAHALNPIDLVGKYHLASEGVELVHPNHQYDVVAHDDFVFSIYLDDDGSTLLFHNFFYHGMDANFVPLDYSAKGTLSVEPNGMQLLTLTATEWHWDDYMGKFMDPYSHNPMLYFAIQRDAQGNITLTSTKNSLGFYVLETGASAQFVYAIDYHNEVVATKLDTYACASEATLPGIYSLSYDDENGRAQTATFSIVPHMGGYALTGLFGDTNMNPISMDADRRGLTMPLMRGESAGYYVSYFGAVVGDCSLTFSFDAEGRLVADNYFCYSADFHSWHDCFNAVATRIGDLQGINSARNTPQASQSTYDLLARPAAKRSQHAGIAIRNNTKILLQRF